MKRSIAALLGTLVFAVIAVTAGALAPARADDVSPGDKSAMQAIISDQVAAFARDDASTAYAFASPAIQSEFTSPDAFMAMVKNGYGPIYRPRSVTFGALAETDAGPVQTVYVTGADGEAFVALYTFQKQPDGSWKINGVRIVKDDSPTI
jgi:ketosteroid isomerase-like protein